ncbi:MAG: DUF3857 domain-containing protein [Phycisphaerae bacterium]|nr:DUF3857 domain-containing protein [Saprospiraceae bacterium]
MLRLFLLLFSIAFTHLAIPLKAQGKEPKMKYGKISDEEISMTSYSPDPAAPAVVLFDKGIVTHRYNSTSGFTLEYEHHKRIKIFNKEAYGFADLALFFYKGQKVTEFKACSYNLEGGKVVETKLNGENVFDEKLTSQVFVKKAAIPAVREGSVIEFKYTVLDEGIGIPVDEWVFQNAIAPTIWSEFEASVPTFIEYKKHAQGWNSFALAKEELKNERISISYVDRGEVSVVTTASSQNINVDYTTNIMHFIQENVPALKPEPFVASVHDYLSQISFDVRAVYQTTLTPSGSSYKLVNGASKERNQTWERLGKDLWEEVYDEVLNSSKFTGSDAAKCIEGKSTPTEKTAAIYSFIGKNYQTTDFDFFWKSQTMDNLTKNHKGTPTDLNLLFINMLRRAKVNAYPVLISTRPNGRALSFRVSVKEFDRVVAAVALEDSTLTLMDASGWPSPIGLLPMDAMNGEGLLLKDKENIAWIPLQSKIVDRSAAIADFTLKPDGTLSGKITFSETGHDAVKARQLISNKGTQAFAQEYYKDMMTGGQITDLTIEENADWNTPVLKGSFELETSAFSSAAGNKIYLTPALSFALKETPFKNPARKFGVDFGPPANATYVFTFKIPTGYTLEEAPKSTKLSFKENALSFDYLVDKSNPELIKITLRKNRRAAFIPVEDFAELQQFYANMVAKMSEQIVLTK